MADTSYGTTPKVRRASFGKARTHGAVAGIDGAYGKFPGAYRSWLAMRARCSNPKHISWKNYGGRGVGVSPTWDDFSAFLRDMGERPDGSTLDRIDPDGPYSAENCRWSTHSDQAKNKRASPKVECGGRSMPVSDACAMANVNPASLRQMACRMGSYQAAFDHLTARPRRKSKQA